MYTRGISRNLKYLVLYDFEMSSGLGNKERIEEIKKSTETTSTLQRDILIRSISKAINGNFASLKVPFDTNKFEESLKKSVDGVLLSDKVPFIAKRKFIEDIKLKISTLSQTTPEDIKTLQTSRNIQSLGMEAFEMKGKSEQEIQAHYLNMIIDSNIQTYVGGAATGLKEAFEVDSLKLNGGEYHARSLAEYGNMITETDGKYGLNIASIAKASKERATKSGVDLMNAGLFLDMRCALVIEIAKRDPNFAQKQSNLISTLQVNPGFQIQYNSGMTANLGGKKYTLLEIVNDYAKVNNTWHKKEYEIRDSRATALADGTLSKIKKTFGMEQMRSEFDNINEGAMEDAIKKANMADMMIMITQVLQITPILGDVIGGAIDLGSLMTGMDEKGRKLGASERAGSAVTGILSIIVVGGIINRVRKGPKYAKMIDLISKYLPAKLEEIKKIGGGFTEDMKNKILKFTRDIGAVVLGEKIQKIFQGGSNIEPAKNIGATENRNLSRATEQTRKTVRVSKEADLPLAQKLNEEIANEAKIRGVPEDTVRKGYLIEREGLTVKQADLVLEAHALGGSNESLGNYTSGTLREKMRIMTRDKVLEPEQARAILKKGYAGNIDNSIKSLGDYSQLPDAEFIRLITDSEKKMNLDSRLKSPEEQILITEFLKRIKKDPNFIKLYHTIEAAEKRKSLIDTVKRNIKAPLQVIHELETQSGKFDTPKNFGIPKIWSRPELEQSIGGLRGAKNYMDELGKHLSDFASDVDGKLGGYIDRLQSGRSSPLSTEDIANNVNNQIKKMSENYLEAKRNFDIARLTVSSHIEQTGNTINSMDILTKRFLRQYFMDIE
ncbi:hypothetical protein H7170_02015 [Candidatus Gracilibacteria bacterium]|nr:hypothetical protein [Candidatus Gracilibacteria bacterium]